jgi:hypothetical protein
MGNLPKSEPLLAQKRNTTNFFLANALRPRRHPTSMVYVAEHHSISARYSRLQMAASAATLG